MKNVLLVFLFVVGHAGMSYAGDGTIVIDDKDLQPIGSPAEKKSVNTQAASKNSSAVDAPQKRVIYDTDGNSFPSTYGVSLEFEFPKDFSIPAGFTSLSIGKYNPIAAAIRIENVYPNFKMNLSDIELKNYQIPYCQVLLHRALNERFTIPAGTKIYPSKVLETLAASGLDIFKRSVSARPDAPKIDLTEYATDHGECRTRDNCQGFFGYDVVIYLFNTKSPIYAITCVMKNTTWVALGGFISEPSPVYKINYSKNPNPSTLNELNNALQGQIKINPYEFR